MKTFGIARSYLAVAAVMFVTGLSVSVIGGLLQRNGTENENTVYAIYDGKKIFAKQVLPQIKEELKNLERNKYFIKKAGVENWLSAEPALKNVKINWRIPMNFIEPAIKVEKGFLPPLMSAQTKKSLIFFGNFHCATCPENYRKLLTQSPNLEGQVNIYFRFAVAETDNPIVLQSALAAACSAEQGQFENFFHILFQAPPTDFQGLTDSARKANLNPENLTACMAAEKTKLLVAADLKDAERFNMGRKPVVFVNRHPIPIQEALEDIETFLAQP